MKKKIHFGFCIIAILTFFCLFNAFSAEVLAAEADLKISEVMVKNHSAVMTGEGLFTDWIEVGNYSEDPISLEGWTLSDGKNQWAFPDIELSGNSFLKIDTKGGSGLAADFGLSENDQLFLRDPEGALISIVEDLHIENDHSLALQPDGSYRMTTWSTPGYPNTLDIQIIVKRFEPQMQS